MTLSSYGLILDEKCLIYRVQQLYVPPLRSYVVERRNILLSHPVVVLDHFGPQTTWTKFGAILSPSPYVDNFTKYLDVNCYYMLWFFEQHSRPALLDQVYQPVPK